jgi:hypothetical protein
MAAQFETRGFEQGGFFYILQLISPLHPTQFIRGMALFSPSSGGCDHGNLVPATGNSDNPANGDWTFNGADRMTRKFRRVLIVGIWVLLMVTVWFLIPRPSGEDDEYTKWFVVSVMMDGVPWFLNLSVAVLVALSLEQRFGRSRGWILAAWSAALAGLVWLHVFRPASFGPFNAHATYGSWLVIGFEVFAIQYLFPMLVGLSIVLWRERKISERSWLAKSLPASH